VHVRTRVCVAALVHVIYVSCTMRHHSCMHRGVRVVAARGPFSLALPTSLALLLPPRPTLLRGGPGLRCESTSVIS
jgi:hypothetical protein